MNKFFLLIISFFSFTVIHAHPPAKNLQSLPAYMHIIKDNEETNKEKNSCWLNFLACWCSSYEHSYTSTDHYHSSRLHTKMLEKYR